MGIQCVTEAYFDSSLCDIRSCAYIFKLPARGESNPVMCEL